MSLVILLSYKLPAGVGQCSAECTQLCYAVLHCNTLIEVSIEHLVQAQIA